MILFVGLGNPTPDSENNRHNVGFKIIEHKDMSSDWERFTNERLKVLQANKEYQEKNHGSEGYKVIEDFYTTAAECFAEKIIGGIRLICKKN